MVHHNNHVPRAKLARQLAVRSTGIAYGSRAAWCIPYSHSLQQGHERVIYVWQFWFDRWFSWTTMRRATMDHSPLEVMT
jgi:hypothetical protein